MKYLFINSANKYFDINNVEVIVNDDLYYKINTKGFNIDEILTIKDKSILLNKRLVTASDTVADVDVKVKVSDGRFIILNFNDVDNLKFSSPVKCIISNDGLAWFNYYNDEKYEIADFDIRLDSVEVDKMSEGHKLEFLRMTDYIRKRCRDINHINSSGMRYAVIEIKDLHDTIYSTTHFNDNNRLMDNEIHVEMSKEKITVMNNKDQILKSLTVQVIKPSDIIINTLKEF